LINMNIGSDYEDNLDENFEEEYLDEEPIESSYKPAKKDK